MGNYKDIVKTILKHYPDVQAIYIFGTYETEYEKSESDVDIALLLSHKTAKDTGSMLMNDLFFELESLLRKRIDLINLRLVNTVFQKEIIIADQRIYCADEYASDEFEMLTISNYQKLNEERAGILEEMQKSGRFLSI